jgi:hypothetical protein
MGGTLHRDRSNTRWSLSTTREENRERWEQPVECRTTTAVLCVEGVWWQELSSYDPLNPEHEAIGRVLWANSTICIACFYFSTRGLWPLSHMKESKNYRDPIFMIIREILQGCSQPDIRQKSKHSSRQLDGKWKHTSKHWLVPMVY